jgi:YfiH family protein
VIRTIRERWVDGPVALLRNEEWAARFPFLVQGTTAGGSRGADFGLFRSAPVGEVMTRWRLLRETTGTTTVVHARQVHGARVLRHERVCAGIVVTDEDADGHVTREPGVLLTVSVADCVPVTLVSTGPHAVAMVHAGWRGAAAGALEAGLGALRDAGADAASIWVHLGPAICGRCYEVGPDVFAALGLDVPGDRLLDLRAVLARRAMDAGIPEAQISVSEWCTRCDGDTLFSHRAGSTGRQLGFVALRPNG